MLRHTGMHELADVAEATLPDPVDRQTLKRFCNAHKLSLSSLMDKMGGSP
jgi:hypothetical protein